MKRRKRTIVIKWVERTNKKTSVKFAGCGSSCYSGTCSSCKN